MTNKDESKPETETKPYQADLVSTLHNCLKHCNDIAILLICSIIEHIVPVTVSAIKHIHHLYVVLSKSV